MLVCRRAVGVDILGMLPVLLTKIKTRDGVTLDGIYVRPKRKSDTAFIWVHGYTSAFYEGQTRTKELSDSLTKNGIAYFNFNTRGYEIVTGWGTQVRGAAFEKFEHCIRDIRAIIAFARKLGYKKIILAGHSTGTNKATYYLYRTKDRAVKKLILLAPINDIAGEMVKIGKRELAKRLAIAEKLNKKDPKLLIPQKFEIASAGRYVSLYRPGTNEDTFPYYNPKAKWKAYSKLKTPIAVVIGSKDEFLDRSPKKFINVFKSNAVSAKSFSGFIIKNAGHSFTKKEKELAKIIVDWVKKT